MKLCMECWGKLKAAINARGVGHLVKTAKGAHAEMIDLLEGKPVQRPDPLMAANNLIWTNALRIAGLELMAPNEDGSEKCPICFLVTNCKCGWGDECPFRGFIDRAADEALSLVSEPDTAPDPTTKETP